MLEAALHEYQIAGLVYCYSINLCGLQECTFSLQTRLPRIRLNQDHRRKHIPGTLFGGKTVGPNEDACKAGQAVLVGVFRSEIMSKEDTKASCIRMSVASGSAAGVIASIELSAQGDKWLTLPIDGEEMITIGVRTRKCLP